MQNGNGSGLNDASRELERVQSRRRFLAGAAMATAGGAAVASFARPDSAQAATLDGFNGWNDVTNPVFGPGGAHPNDPSQDSAPAIQDALNQSAGNAAVYFPPGTYYLGNGLLVPNRSVLIGHGVLSVLAVKTGSTLAGGTSMVHGVNGTGVDIEIENLKLDSSNRTTLTGNAHCIFFGAGSERVFIRRVECFATPGIGIYLSNVKNCGVHDCHIYKCGKDGIGIWNGSDMVIVQGNLVHDNGDDHISVVNGGGGNSKRVSIVDNIISNVDPATNYTGGATRIGSSIALRGAEQIQIVGNVVRGGYRAAIELNSSAAVVKDIEIVGNYISEAGNHNPPEDVAGVGGGSGILLQVPGGNQMERVNIQDNQIVAPRLHGVYLKNTTTSEGLRDVSIDGNIVSFDAGATYRAGTGSGVACIDPGASVTDVKVSNNEIIGSIGPGIYAKGSSTSVTTVVRWDIHGNKVVNSGTLSVPQSGIHLREVQTVSVVGNRALDKIGVQDYGLIMIDPREAVMITNNDFVENGQNPIQYSDSSFGPTRLRIRDNPTFNPWTGTALLNPTGWTGVGPYTLEVAVTFGVRFPAGQPPKVFATVQDIDAYAIAKNVTESGFTLRVVSITKPTTQQKAGWIAEPLET